MVSAMQWFLGKFNVNRRSCSYQRCESDAPCNRLMNEAYTSYRRSPLDFFRSWTMTQPSAASSESSHDTLLPLRMWLLNVGERMLSGGGSTRRSFLIDLRVVRYCGDSVTSLVPDFLSLGHGVTKPKLKNSQKIMVLSKLENFYGALFSGKQRISWAKILIGSLRYVTLLSHGRQQEVSCFPI